MQGCGHRAKKVKSPSSAHVWLVFQVFREEAASEREPVRCGHTGTVAAVSGTLGRVALWCWGWGACRRPESRNLSGTFLRADDGICAWAGDGGGGGSEWSSGVSLARWASGGAQR